MINSSKLIGSSDWKPESFDLEMLEETGAWNSSVRLDHKNAKEVAEESVHRFTIK